MGSRRLYLYSVGIVHEDECTSDSRLRLQALTQHLKRFDSRGGDQSMGDGAWNHATGPHLIHRHTLPTVLKESMDRYAFILLSTILE